MMRRAAAVTIRLVYVQSHGAYIYFDFALVLLLVVVRSHLGGNRRNALILTELRLLVKKAFHGAVWIDWGRLR